MHYASHICAIIHYTDNAIAHKAQHYITSHCSSI